MKTSQKGISLLVDFEGFRPNAYIPVPGDVPTIGFGFTKGVKIGDTMSMSEATARLRSELVEYEHGVANACMVETNQNQFDALVCLAYNIGVGAFKKSTVLKLHNKRDYNAAARAFSMWNKSGGKVYPGLVRRRAAEAALYLEPTQATFAEPVHVMPQTVDEEKPMAASSINRASVVAGGTASIAAVTQTLDAVKGVKDGVESLGSWLVPALLIAVVGLCAYVVWQRFDMRKKGMA